VTFCHPAALWERRGGGRMTEATEQVDRSRGRVTAPRDGHGRKQRQEAGKKVRSEMLVLCSFN